MTRATNIKQWLVVGHLDDSSGRTAEITVLAYDAAEVCSVAVKAGATFLTNKPGVKFVVDSLARIHKPLIFSKKDFTAEFGKGAK